MYLPGVSEIKDITENFLGKNSGSNACIENEFERQLAIDHYRNNNKIVIDLNGDLYFASSFGVKNPSTCCACKIRGKNAIIMSDNSFLIIEHLASLKN